jgi:hypothetical protein
MCFAAPISEYTSFCDQMKVILRHQQTLEWERHGRGSDGVRPEASPAAAPMAAVANAPAPIAAAEREPAAPLVADIELPPHLAGYVHRVRIARPRCTLMWCPTTLVNAAPVWDAHIKRGAACRSAWHRWVVQEGANERCCANGGGRGSRRPRLATAPAAKQQSRSRKHSFQTKAATAAASTLMGWQTTCGVVLIGPAHFASQRLTQFSKLVVSSPLLTGSPFHLGVWPTQRSQPGSGYHIYTNLQRLDPNLPPTPK